MQKLAARLSPLWWMPLFLFFTLGCISGLSVQTRAKALHSAHSKARPDKPVLYFAPEPNGVPYTQIATLKVTGRSRSTLEDLKREMRRLAQDKGADAVINLETSTTTRSIKPTGVLAVLAVGGKIYSEINPEDNDCPEPDDADDDYTAIVLRGEAIVYDKNLVEGPPPAEEDWSE